MDKKDRESVNGNGNELGTESKNAIDVDFEDHHCEDGGNNFEKVADSGTDGSAALRKYKVHLKSQFAGGRSQNSSGLGENIIDQNNVV